MESRVRNIRNFCIFAHVDHGKSTLADRLLELTGTVDSRQMKPQYLDQMELERERGITIKMAPVRMDWRPSRRLARMEADSRGLLYEGLTYKIRGALFNVYNALGSGHKENVYQNSLEIEFKKLGLEYEREKRVDVIYEDKKVGLYQPDFVIEGKIVIELKALPFLGDPPKKQARYYLKGSHYKLALLVNFGGSKLEIERIIYDSIRENQPVNPHESAGLEYILNLIDTPGHSDFSYEVSRALAAVEGGVLLVDASQGIEAQTLVNFDRAKRVGLTIIGAVNKIDLFVGREDEIDRRVRELARLMEVPEAEILRISGKTGEGVEELLHVVIEKIPAPENLYPHESALDQRKSALIFDSLYDDHKGIIAFVRVFGGSFRGGDTTKLLTAGEAFKVKEVGYFRPKIEATESVAAGEIGYIATGIKDPDILRIGDTIGEQALPGYEPPRSVVFVSFYPDTTRTYAYSTRTSAENKDYDNLHLALRKLKLNDSSLEFEPEKNNVLGRGFRCGFLGQLHFEITAERLKKDFNIDVISTFPSVAYKVKKGDSYEIIHSAERLTDIAQTILEPIVGIRIISPAECIGNVLQLSRRFRAKDIFTQPFDYAHGKPLAGKILLTAIMPLTSLIEDFDGSLKSVSSGMASMSYEMAGEAPADLEKVEILVAGDPVPGLTRFMYRDTYETESRKILAKLKDLLPQQQFAQALQARAGGRIIARETIPAMRKDVTGYLYGGDRTRKMKLWKKQKRGKERLQSAGRVTIPPSIFKELLKK
ncbi:GxxExxY protein [Candidatus Wolfebacteria bacterium]|nr:GxxExxY protein [Candidatus Wolfebacteria bacterium]